jgi:hypothetical protein
MSRSFNIIETEILIMINEVVKVIAVVVFLLNKSGLVELPGTINFSIKTDWITREI